MTGDFDAFDDLDLADHEELPDQDLPVEDDTDAGADDDTDDVRAAADSAVAPVTGHPRVDAATAVLDALDDLPTADHAELFEDVHRRLQGALSDLDGD